MADYIRLRHGSMVVSTIWMTAGAVLFFWAPFINGVMAGAAGGWRAARMGRAVEAALAATALSTGAFFVGYHVFQIPPSYLYFGLGIVGWMLATGVGLVLGALMGAYGRSSLFVSERWGRRDLVRATVRRSHEGPPVTGAPTSRFDESL